jgi:predicted nucleic acid-binding protein
MGDKVFLDSNLLIYAVSNELEKKQAVQKLLLVNYEFVISTQVLNEFSNICFKKNLLSLSDITKASQGFCQFFQVETIVPATIFSAYSIRDRYGFSFYDALIIATAKQSGCKILFSEDLQHNQLIDNVLKIENPLLKN